MTDFRGNIDNWIRHAEPDYYVFFLKVWIPFNAWYVAELPALKKRDSEIIKELQDNINSKPRKVIENFLLKSNHDAVRFRSHLAELHHYLDKNILLHNSKRLSFRELSLTVNPITIKKDVDSKGILYKAEKTSSYFQAYVEEKGGKVMLDFKQGKYLSEDLKRDNDFTRLSNKKIQERIFNYYLEIDPKKSIDLVSKSAIKSQTIYLESRNSCKFINDVETVAKGCIKILYALRCMLFHGEIEPNNNNLPVYENAYYLLRYILKELN